MIEKLTGSENLPIKIAETISELPELPHDMVRVVHLCNIHHKDYLLENGLDYTKYGMAMSMARAWGNAEEVEYYSDDPRFSGEGVKALVMDITNDEWRLHNNVSKCPGIIERDRIVGFVDSFKPE